MTSKDLETITSEITLQIVDGKVVAISTDVARHFGKRHDDVLKTIRNLLPELPADDRLRNFAETVIERPNPSGGEPIKSPAYRMTRDGFTLLAFRFNGQRALRFQLAYIKAFNRMEERLAQQKDKASAGVEAEVALQVAVALLKTLNLIRQAPSTPSARPDVIKMLLAVLNVSSLEQASKDDLKRIPDFLQGLILGEVAGKSEAANSLAYSRVGTDLIYHIVQAAHQTEMHVNAIRARQVAGEQYGDPSALHRIADELAELSNLTRELITHLANYTQHSAKKFMH